MTQGRAARAAVARAVLSPTTSSTRPCRCSTATPSPPSCFPALASGATLALRRRFSASSFLPDVRAVRRHLLQHRRPGHRPHRGHPADRARPRPPAPVRARAGDVARPTRRRSPSRFGVPLFEGYGSSENAIILKPVAGAGPDALGGPATGTTWPWSTRTPARSGPGAASTSTAGCVNAARRIGELVGRNVLANFEGYYNNPEADAERTRNGWYWSGDLAYRDDDGIFYFAGRTGDWLRVDSENFAAAPVERILSRFEPARGVAVYPVPDEPHRRPGDGGPRAGAGTDLRPRSASPPSWPPRRTSAPSGRPATCGLVSRTAGHGHRQDGQEAAAGASGGRPTTRSGTGWVGATATYP